MEKYGGRGGIRTPGTIARSMLFESTPFDHSGTLPLGRTSCAKSNDHSSQLIKTNGIVVKQFSLLLRWAIGDDFL